MMWRGVGTLACAAMLLLTGCDEQTIPRGAVVGNPAPEFAASDLQDRPVSLADHQGRLVLLNVWATWCPPCRDEIPALQELHERHVAGGLDVVGVSIDSRGERDNVGAFAGRFGVTYPIWLDPSERVTSVFRTQGVPTTFLIGRDGTVLWRHVGPVTADHPELNRLISENL
jgi:cytochrome c biogenesis protein CcmG, thiol:disulfide interchange protein DsbE